MTIWWWCVLVMMVPLSIIFMCCIFIVCPYFDERVLSKRFLFDLCTSSGRSISQEAKTDTSWPVKCSTPTAVRRENDILRASAFMDIFTDVLRTLIKLSARHPYSKYSPFATVISIPVALLWRVRIPLQRKLMLGGILSLSIFTMIVSIVRIAGADLPNGMVDSAWVNFWLQIEAAVAVIVISISAYRSLFVVAKSSHGHHGGGGKSPRYGSSTLSAVSYRKRLWSRIRGGDEKGEGGGGGGGGRGDEEVQLPTLPDPGLTGVRTVIGRADGRMGGRSSSEEEFLSRDSRSIFVRREAEVASVSL